MGQHQGKQGNVPVLARIDVLAGALISVFAVLVWLDSASLEVGTLAYFGSGFMPRVLSVALLAGGLVLLVRGLTRRPGAADRLVLAGRGPLAVTAAILVFAMTIRGFALGPLPIPQLGLLIAGPVTVILAGLGTAHARPKELVVLGLGLTAAAILVFVDALGMQLPVFPDVIADHLPTAWGPDWPRRIAALALGALAYGLWRAFGLSLAALADPADGGETP